MAELETEKAVTVFETRHAETLVRIDERTRSLVDSFKEFQDSTNKKMDELKSEVKADVAAIEKRLDDKVSNEAFKPVKLIAYGMAGLILVTVIGAIVTNNLIINNNNNNNPPQISKMSR